MQEGTFAASARDGLWYGLTCQSCGHQSQRTAAALVAAGWGNVAVVGSQERFRCGACGQRGCDLWLNGYWRGPSGEQPADWAETVEQRMAKASQPCRCDAELRAAGYSGAPIRPVLRCE